MRRPFMVFPSDSEIAGSVGPRPSLPSVASVEQLVESRLDCLLPPAEMEPRPLHRAMRYAVFSGGKRLRPQLLLQVAIACGAGPAELELAMRAACGVEFIHTASLVHDDLPCFDDAGTRRGRPSVHVAFGQPLAVLVGDALLALAFESLGDVPPQLAQPALRIVRLLGRATGSSLGIIGGQSLEQGDGGAPEGAPIFSAQLIERYHQMKTAALFQLATEAGAVAAGSTNGHAWAAVGRLVGLWYQLADDLLDVSGHHQALGKPVGQDAAHDRPNAIACRGATAVRAEMQALLGDARARIRTLAAAPAPLIAFMDAACQYLLQPLERVDDVQ